MGKHSAGEVVPALKKWITKLDKKDPAYEHQMLEALWVHQWMNVVDEDLLKRELRSPDYHARAAATRVLCYWRDRVKDPIGLLEAQAKMLTGKAVPREMLQAAIPQRFLEEE